jgi:hypothetical protein
MNDATVKFMMDEFQKMREETARSQAQMFDLFKQMLANGGGESSTKIMANLSARIAKFVPDAEMELCFSRWFQRHESIFTEDGVSLDDKSRARLLLEKLDSDSFDKYQQFILPEVPSKFGFDDTVMKLKSLFDRKQSLFTQRYQTLRIEKSPGEDLLSYTARVNEQCEKSEIGKLKSNELKCLLWVFGLKHASEAELVKRLIMYLDNRHKNFKDGDPTVTLDDLFAECEVYQNVLRDAKMIGSGTKQGSHVDVHVVTEHMFTCWNCGDSHKRGSKCNKSKVTCRKCFEEGHLEKFCAKVASWKSKRKNVKKTNAVDITMVELVTGSVESELNVNSLNRTIVVNGVSVDVQVDTGADVTLLSEAVWTRLGSPTLRPATVVVRGASRDPMKILGLLTCQFEIDGCRRRGVAYVNPFKNLLGMEWIRKIPKLRYHAEMLVSSMLQKNAPGVTVGLKARFPEVISPNIGYCAKEELSLALQSVSKPLPCESVVPMCSPEAVHDEEDGIVSVEVKVDAAFVAKIKQLCVTVDDVRAETHSDPLLKRILKFVMCGTWPEKLSDDPDVACFQRRRNELSVIHDCLVLNDRVVMPKNLQSIVLKKLHLSHSGIVQMKNVARRFCYWPRIDADCKRIAKDCAECRGRDKKPLWLPGIVKSARGSVNYDVCVDHDGSKIVVHKHGNQLKSRIVKEFEESRDDSAFWFELYGLRDTSVSKTTEHPDFVSASRSETTASNSSSSVAATPEVPPKRIRRAPERYGSPVHH